MAPAPAALAWWQPFALAVFARLPRGMRVRLVRALAPSHTVGALCFVEHDGAILMLRQRHRRGWSLPGGLIERGETAAQAVVREVAEETALRVEVGQPLTTVVEPRTRRVDVLFHVPVTRRPDAVAGGEALEAAWLRPDEASPVDEPTATALATFLAALAPDARRGRALDL